MLNILGKTLFVALTTCGLVGDAALVNLTGNHLIVQSATGSGASAAQPLAAQEYATLGGLTLLRNSVNAGSGAYTSFLRLQNNGTERGLNEMGTFDTKSGVRTDLQHFSKLPSYVSSITGPGHMFEFVLDLNEAQAGLSLDQWIVFASVDPQNPWSAAGAGINKLSAANGSLQQMAQDNGALIVFDMNAEYNAGRSGEQNHFLLSDTGGNGGGTDDYVLYVPTLALDQAVAASPDTLSYDNTLLWVYAEFGGFTGDVTDANGKPTGFSADGGFEELAFNQDGTHFAPDEYYVHAPEPSSFLLMVLSTATTALGLRRRMQR